MKKTEELSNRFTEVMLNGRWIANTNFKEALQSVDWHQANKKVKNLNTIYLLTKHINYYINGIIAVFEGGELEIRDKYSFYFLPLTSSNQWEDIKEELIKNSEKFSHYVKKISERQLQQPFVDKKYGSYQRNIEAMIEHSYYHLGQISLLKKLTEK